LCAFNILAKQTLIKWYQFIIKTRVKIIVASDAHCFITLSASVLAVLKSLFISSESGLQGSVAFCMGLTY